MKQDKTIKKLKECSPVDIKKVAVYQNLKCFIPTTLFFEYINPKHKILVWGIKKRKYRKTNYTHYEKVALMFRNSLPFYFFISYVIIGWFLCNI